MSNTPIDTDEPNLDEQLERIASIACGAELGLLDDEIVDEDIKRMNATTRANKDRLKKLIKALIATQINQARIAETKLWYNQWGKGSEIIGDGSWEDFYEYRLKELQGE